MNTYAKRWTREDDVAVEKAAGERLEAWFRSKKLRYEKAEDRERQFRGVDYVIWDKNGRPLNVDVKAKFHGLQGEQRFPRAFSFEIDRTCRDGERRVGWFADPRSLTDVYVYQYPKFANGKDLEGGLAQDMVCHLFPKAGIVKLVGGFDVLPGLVVEAREMYENDESRREKDGFALYKTRPGLYGDTQPVNILVEPEKVRAMRSFREFTV